VPRHRGLEDEDARGAIDCRDVGLLHRYATATVMHYSQAAVGSPDDQGPGSPLFQAVRLPPSSLLHATWTLHASGAYAYFLLLVCFVFYCRPFGVH
jgi:hypothetical protein